MIELLLLLLLKILLWSFGFLIAIIGIFVGYHRFFLVSRTRVLRPSSSSSPPSRQRTIAFFHPYCSSGGGGERVLWAVIQALGEIHNEGLSIHVVIYTVDPFQEEYKKDVLQKVTDRFSLEISSSLDISFVHLDDCAHHLERASRLSMLVESWGTMRLAYTALMRSLSSNSSSTSNDLFPTIFFDTTGCAFTYLVAKGLFGCTVIAYVHYPTISTDMLSMVWERRPATYNNQAYITNSRFTTIVKLIYYTMFALAYGTTGSLCDLVMVNSTWTYNHINSIWWFASLLKRIHVVFPPCRISSSSSTSSTSSTASTTKRERIILSIGQFRPEKDHELQIESMSLLFAKHPTLKGDIKMVMVGGCRNQSDERRLQHLKDMSKRLHLNNNDDNDNNNNDNSIIFSVNQPYAVVEEWLRKSSIGIHTMWNEHFGIGVVEMMSAGLLTIAHDSGGPKSDIIVPLEGKPTGFRATTAEQYADAIHQALQMMESSSTTSNNNAADELRARARESAKRFSDEEFNKGFKRTILESRLLG